VLILVYSKTSVIEEVVRMVVCEDRIKHRYYLTPEDFEIAEKNGISYQTAHRRVYMYNWSIERAITQPVQKINRRYDGWKDWKHKALVSKSTFVKRVNMGWGERKAAMTPPMSFSDAAKMKSKYTERQKRIAKENGVSMTLVSHRVTRMGWSVHKAITTPPRSKSQCGKMGMAKRWN